MAKKVLAIVAVIFLVVGFFINISFFMYSTMVSAPVAVYLLIFKIFYALFYIFCWLLLLFAGLKRNSKSLLNLYQAFWLMSIAFLILSQLIPPASWFDGIVVLGWFVFNTPLIGLSTLVFRVVGSDFHAATYFASLVVPVIMSILGFLARRKLREM